MRGDTHRPGRLPPYLSPTAGRNPVDEAFEETQSPIDKSLVQFSLSKSNYSNETCSSNSFIPLLGTLRGDKQNR